MKETVTVELPFGEYAFEVEYHVEDFGIGPNEYWGAPGDHVDLVYVIDDLTLETPEFLRPDEHEDDEVRAMDPDRFYEKVMELGQAAVEKKMAENFEDYFKEEL